MGENVTSKGFFSERTGKILVKIGMGAVVIAIIVFLIWGDWKCSKFLDEAKIGQFGDFIGGVIGSIFSLAGVILFYIALKEQRRDININQENLALQVEALNHQVEEFKAQKEELKETRKVYEDQTRLIEQQTELYIKQNKEIKEQTSIAKLQQFDSSFFSYMDALGQYKEKINRKTASKNIFGEIIYELSSANLTGENIIDSLEAIKTKYLKIFNNNKNDLSIYFKTLYRIMVLIDSSTIDELRKTEYFKFLRAQISEDELMVLHYNYQTNLGIKVQSFLIKYNFFKHLKILDRPEICQFYPENYKIEMENFLNFIEEYINETIFKYSSIEEENDINFSRVYQIYDMNVEIKIEMVRSFSFSLIFSKQQFLKNEVLTKEMLLSIMKRSIISMLYILKYKSYSEGELEEKTIETNDKIEFNFIIKDNTNK